MAPGLITLGNHDWNKQWNKALGFRENTMETTIVYWGYIGIMKNEMEATIFSGTALSRSQTE